MLRSKGLKAKRCELPGSNENQLENTLPIIIGNCLPLKKLKIKVKTDNNSFSLERWRILLIVLKKKTTAFIESQTSSFIHPRRIGSQNAQSSRETKFGKRSLNTTFAS